MIASGVLLVVGIVSDDINQYTTWLSYPLLAYIAYLIYRKEEFKQGKSVLVAVLPFIIVLFLGKIVQLINAGFYQLWEDLFDVAGIFSVIWMIVMLYITNKQNKALAREREKTLAGRKAKPNNGQVER